MTRVPAVGIAILLAAGAASAQELQPRIGDPLPGLTAVERALFDSGKVEFTRILSAADGLGPIFNDSSCSTCHSSPRAGGAGSKRVTRFGRAAVGPTPFDPLASLGGSLLQVSATLPTCVETVPPVADVADPARHPVDRRRRPRSRPSTAATSAPASSRRRRA